MSQINNFHIFHKNISYIVLLSMMVCREVLSGYKMRILIRNI